MFYTIEELSNLKKDTAESLAEKAFWNIMEEFPKAYSKDEKEDFLQDCYMVSFELFPLTVKSNVYTDNLVYFKIYRKLKDTTIEKIQRDNRFTYISQKEITNYPDLKCEDSFDRVSLQSDLQHIMNQSHNSSGYTILIGTEVCDLTYKTLEEMFSLKSYSIYRLKQLAMQRFKRECRHLYDAY